MTLNRRLCKQGGDTTTVALRHETAVGDVTGGGAIVARMVADMISATVAVGSESLAMAVDGAKVDHSDGYADWSMCR